MHWRRRLGWLCPVSCVMQAVGMAAAVVGRRNETRGNGVGGDWVSKKALTWRRRSTMDWRRVGSDVMAMETVESFFVGFVPSDQRPLFWEHEDLSSLSIVGAQRRVWTATHAHARLDVLLLHAHASHRQPGPGARTGTRIIDQGVRHPNSATLRLPSHHFDHHHHHPRTNYHRALRNLECIACICCASRSLPTCACSVDLTRSPSQSVSQSHDQLSSSHLAIKSQQCIDQRQENNNPLFSG